MRTTPPTDSGSGHAPQIDALTRLRGQVQAAAEDLRSRLGPALDGLPHVAAGGRFDVSAIASQPGGGFPARRLARTGSSRGHTPATPLTDRQQVSRLDAIVSRSDLRPSGSHLADQVEAALLLKATKGREIRSW
jgi:hypothetical protein